MRLTIDKALQIIHRTYEGDTSYLEFEDEETELRLEYLKDGIQDWTDKFPEYKEQFVSLVDASNGDKLTTSAVTYNTPTNFIRPSGNVKIGDSIYLTYIDPSDMDGRLQENSSSQWYTILGAPGAYRLKINPGQVAGSAINYDYFGELTMPTTTTSLIPLSRPLYCVHYVLWKIFSEDDPARAMEQKELMNEQIRLERVALAKTPGTPTRLIIGGAGLSDRSGGPSNIRTDQ